MAGSRDMAKNSYFQFKQFTVHQDLCAMKVCTDACVLGAWASLAEHGRILDIGAGTGLLSLMAAQRFQHATIDAVELDHGAYSQAVENIAKSPFSDRIRVFHTAIQDFKPDYQYNSIITNPPFFQSDLLSPNGLKNQAHHATTLTFDALLASIDRLLVADGHFHILLPTEEAVVFGNKATVLGWSMCRKLTLRHNKQKKPFRTLMTFGRSYLTDNQLYERLLDIYEADTQTYDPEFKALMKHFYMIF